MFITIVGVIVAVLTLAIIVVVIIGVCGVAVSDTDRVAVNELDGVIRTEVLVGTLTVGSDTPGATQARIVKIIIHSPRKRKTGGLGHFGVVGLLVCLTRL